MGMNGYIEMVLLIFAPVSIIHQLCNTFTEQSFTLLANTLTLLHFMATQKTKHGNEEDRAKRQSTRQKCPEDLTCSGWTLLPTATNL